MRQLTEIRAGKMIKRHYFFSCKAHISNNSFSSKYFTMSLESLFPLPNKAYRACLLQARSEFEEAHIPTDKIHVIAFNRI